MKKNYFLGAAAAFGLLAFSSCSNDEDPILGPDNQELMGEQVIVLDMQDTDVLSTKSRPLYSTTNKGAEEVTDVKLLFFKVENDNTQTLIKEVNIPNWDQISTDYNYGRKYSIRLKGEDRLKLGDGEGYDIVKDGKITIVAVGQNEKKTTLAPFTWGNPSVSLPGWTIPTNENDRKWTTVAEVGKGFAPLFTNEVGKDNFTSVSEIFSGTSETTPVQLDGGFEAKVLLKRQVAGVLGYFNNIPAIVGEAGNEQHIKYVRLVASQRNTQLDLTVQLAQQEDDATETDAALADKIVNGFSTTVATKDAKYLMTTQGEDDAYTVYTIDLSKWFTGWGDESGWSDDSKTTDGLLNPDKWVNAFNVANQNPCVAQGAVLAGEFVIPFEKVTTANTFELQLLTKDLIVAKAWNVNLDADSQGDGDGKLVYNIYRNHLYQIGQRGNGDDPEKPGDKDDKPQPLNKDQDLVIKINDNWEFIHNMEIE